VPAVSVITPAYNVAAFIRDTLDSVFAQTFQDWELVIVDDGSTDDTAAIAAEYAARDGRVRLIRQENRGLAGARNTALAAAQGEFLTLLDSDDIWDPGFLASQLAVFARHPDTGLVTGSARWFGGPFDGQLVRPEVEGAPAVALEEMLADEAAIFIMTTFRRAVVESIGLFDATKRRSEDWDFWLRAVQAGFVMRRNTAPLARYRVRDGSLSSDRRAMLKEMLHTLGKAHRAAAPGTAAWRAAVEQIARFERELLLEDAKAALERGDTRNARASLQTLSANGGGAIVTFTAWLAGYAPAAAIAAYRLRRLRPRWMRVGQPHPARPGQGVAA
jgi:glycosyltransferase involved in cell wall biosynthesis